MSSKPFAIVLAALLLPVAALAEPLDLAAPQPGVLRENALQALGAAPAASSVALIATFAEGADRTSLLREAGLTTRTMFQSFPVAYAEGPRAAWERLAALRGVVAIEANERLDYHLASAVNATRVREVHNGVGGIGPYLGTDINVAIIDSGIDCTHPDLAARCVAGRNLQFVYGTDKYVSLPNTDSSGHGTHLAGIVAGDGSASNGVVRGVAPEARLYGYGHGAAIFIAGALSAYDHIAWGYSPMVVVLAAFGTPGEADAAMTQAMRSVVAQGTTIVVSAGNGGDGGPSADNINRYCKVKDAWGNSLQGVVCVGAYSDGNVGSVEGGIVATSSRGAQTDSQTWPDLVAPGHNIESARASTATTAAAGAASWHPAPPERPRYMVASGTSAAAAHVAGVVALTQQAVTKMPYSVENALVNSAYSFHNYAPVPNRHAGFGLVDAQNAVRYALGHTRAAMTPELLIPTNVFEGMAFSSNLNLGSVGTFSNALAQSAGAPPAVPSTSYMTPGAFSFFVRGAVFDAGGTSLGTARSDIAATAHLVFLQSGRQELHLLTPNSETGYFKSPPIAYNALYDGDIEMTFSYVVGPAHEMTDGEAKVRYESTV